MNTSQDELRRDLDAALQTRKELGKEYESEIVDSFLARIDSRLDARVEQRVAERLDRSGGGPSGVRGRGARLGLSIVSLVMGIPLTAIASESAGTTGLIACWIGIVGVNVASALGDRHRGRELPRDTRSEWV
ncbi:hypothetical protein AB0K43_28450 [Kitasatospora sp. NPDC049258]|uniref:hypothetical protein n=1 Tax=Kitasatospora sp. NPDC049258 TaxID=3155394 RepID=UPI00342B0860